MVVQQPVQLPVMPAKQEAQSITFNGDLDMIEKRLVVAKKLFDSGLISKEIYDRKAGQIIDQL